MEGHWHTNSPSQGASWALLAVPDATCQGNRWAIKIPDTLSLRIRYSATRRVRGLTLFPRRDQPPVWIPFYAFRLSDGSLGWPTDRCVQVQAQAISLYPS
ncbi:MAG: cytochrome ubiquinol oxidase subunit I [Acidiferrobacteraceae bacterium]